MLPPVKDVGLPQSGSTDHSATLCLLNLVGVLAGGGEVSILVAEKASCEPLLSISVSHLHLDTPGRIK